MLGRQKKVSKKRPLRDNFEHNFNNEKKNENDGMNTFL